MDLASIKDAAAGAASHWDKILIVGNTVVLSATALAARTKNKVDDRIVARLGRLLGKLSVLPFGKH